MDAVSTAEVIQGFVHVRARRSGRFDAAARGRELASMLGPLISPGAAELALGQRLFEDHEGLAAFDAVLAAAAILCGANALVSADRALASVPRLVWMDPGSAGMARLLDS